MKLGFDISDTHSWIRNCVLWQNKHAGKKAKKKGSKRKVRDSTASFSRRKYNQSQHWMVSHHHYKDRQWRELNGQLISKFSIKNHFLAKTNNKGVKKKERKKRQHAFRGEHFDCIYAISFAKWHAVGHSCPAIGFEAGGVKPEWTSVLGHFPNILIESTHGQFLSSPQSFHSKQSLFWPTN